MGSTKRITCAITAILSFASGVRGDGCVIKQGGVLVPEKEQRAFIEWKDGRELLYLAIRTAETSESSLWIVPVPAAPELIRAEPTTEFPSVRWARDPVEAVRKTVALSWFQTLALDTGTFPLGCCLLMGGCGAAQEGVRTRDHPDFDVFLRKEQHGMVVEVITARSSTGLNAYLKQRELAVQAGELSGLTSYLGGEFSLICAWTAARGEPIAARAVCIEFPTTTVFYPLRPTRIYQDDIDTSIFVRGWVRPKVAAGFPGTRFQYLKGGVTEVTLPSWFTDKLPTEAAPSAEPLTRIELSRSPRDWEEDLYLEQGLPTSSKTADVLEYLGIGGLWFIQAGLALVLGLFLPFVVVVRGQRHWEDWLWGGLLGVGLCASIYAAGYLFRQWHRGRGLPFRPCNPRRFGIVCAVPAACISATLVGTLVISKTSAVEAWLLLAFVLIAFTCLVAQYGTYLARETGGSCYWFLAFVAGHFLTYSGFCICLLALLP